MFRGQGKLILVMLSGLVLGSAAGYGRKGLRSNRSTVAEVVPELDVASFATAGETEAGAALARQLPAADAEKCAALAKEMLAKRVKVNFPNDPFSDDPTWEIREEYLPERAWEGLFKRWMKVAPQSAWEFVLANHNEELPLREAALRQWAMIDPTSAVRAAGEEITDDEKRVMLKACAESHPGIGLNLIAEWGLQFDTFETFDPFLPPESLSLVEKMLMSLAESSPVAAMEWCLAHVPSKVDSVCVGWLRHDASACMQWMQARPVDEQKHLMSTICEQADVTASSVRYLANLCEPGNQWHWIDRGLLSLAQRDDALAQTLIDELLTNPTHRLVARSEIANVIAETDPRKAIEFILPALRQALPLFEKQSDIFTNNSLPSSIGISVDPFESHYSGLTSVIRSYLELGPAAGVGKTEVNDLMEQIHPQYYPSLIEENFNELKAVLGPPVQWIEPYTAKMSREQIASLVADFDYSSSDQARQDALSLKPGPLRDAVAENYIAILLENHVPVVSVRDSAKELGGDSLDYSGIYEYWMKEQPAEVLKHIAQDTQSSVSEWQSVISAGYEMYGAEIQDMVESLPEGDVRNAAAQSLAELAMTRDNDYVSSMYWATEISARVDRSKKMRVVLEAWLADDDAIRDTFMMEGIRSNIENSSLDEHEKSLWLERMESEVPR